MMIYGYTSRAIPDPQIFADVLETRMKAKKEGDKTTANCLKLVANTTYGASGARFNELFDPLAMRSVCISGQLFLLELAGHLRQEIPDLEIVQLNTDGLMLSFDDSQYEKVLEIINEWQERTGFTLEEDEIKQIVQANVNAYIEVQKNGSIKTKGGKLVRGVLTNAKLDFTQMGFPDWENISGGAFKINNDAVIIPRAVIRYLVDGIPVEDTVNASQDIFDFQIISKAGGKYERCYTTFEDKEVPVQKVNRVYATKDKRLGTIYKIHGTTGRPAKVGGLPEHCKIDNDNHCGIWVVDKEWYIRQAKETVNMFLGIKPPKVNKRAVNSLVRKAMKILEDL